jgi:hypothetical protein
MTMRDEEATRGSLVELVARMRMAQRQCQRTRRPEDLTRSRRLEIAVDEALERIDGDDGRPGRGD